MIKGIKRNVECRQKNRKSMYDQEYKLTHELLASDDTNIEIEYYNKKEAHNASQAVARYIKTVRQPLYTVQRGQFLIICKRETKEEI